MLRGAFILKAPGPSQCFRDWVDTRSGPQHDIILHMSSSGKLLGVGRSSYTHKRSSTRPLLLYTHIALFLREGKKVMVASAKRVFTDYLPATGGEGRFKAALKRASFVSSLTSSRFTTHRRSPLSPLSPLRDQKEDAPYSDRPTADTHPELAGTLQDITAELSSDATSNGIYELAPDPERSLINSPRHSNSSPTKSDFTGSSAAGYSGSLVGPNLNATRNRQSTTENSAGSNPHVMSWMNYHPDVSKNQ